MTQEDEREAVAAKGTIRFQQPIARNGRLGDFAANPAAEIAVFLDGIQIVSVKTNPPHPGHRFAFRRFNTNRQTVRNCKYFRFNVICSQYSADAFFNAEGFRTVHSKAVT